LLKDRFNRDITYLRFSVTPRCNFRCVYCSSYSLTDFEEPTLDEIEFILKVSSQLGFTKVRITGGEPLVREDIVDIVKIAKKANFNEVVLTTNGFRLKEIASELKKAGLDRVNVSLDSLRKETFYEITKVDKFEDVYDGIKKAVEVGFNPIKINTVLLKKINEEDIIPIVELAKDLPITVRFIELMPVKGNTFFDNHFMSYKDAIKIIESKYELKKYKVIEHEVANYYKIEGFKGLIGFITSVSQHFCASCNRLRLTSNFKIFPCLFSSNYISIKDAVKERNEDLLKSLFEEAVYIKPEAHGEIKIGSKDFIENMRELGG